MQGWIALVLVGLVGSSILICCSHDTQGFVLTVDDAI